ncbi:hypothetical protein [Sodalis-like endosymbiont of Proechinophthirus fluctus]|nr:hypothetical protein [Sodalis-like endosymbiont of Proechinophthirus fluctus]
MPQRPALRINDFSGGKALGYYQTLFFLIDHDNFCRREKLRR